MRGKTDVPKKKVIFRCNLRQAADGLPDDAESDSVKILKTER